MKRVLDRPTDQHDIALMEALLATQEQAHQRQLAARRYARVGDRLALLDEILADGPAVPSYVLWEALDNAQQRLFRFLQEQAKTEYEAATKLFNNLQGEWLEAFAREAEGLRPEVAELQAAMFPDTPPDFHAERAASRAERQRSNDLGLLGDRYFGAPSRAEADAARAAYCQRWPNSPPPVLLDHPNHWPGDRRPAWSEWNKIVCVACGHTNYALAGHARCRACECQHRLFGVGSIRCDTCRARKVGEWWQHSAHSGE